MWITDYSRYVEQDSLSVRISDENGFQAGTFFFLANLVLDEDEIHNSKKIALKLTRT